MRTNYWLLVLVAFLSGCSSLESKLLDISGAVFVLFIFLFISKQIISNIINSEKFKLFHSKYISPLFSLVYFLVVPLYLVSLLFLLNGIAAEGIGKISIFISILIYLLASQIKKLKKQPKLKDQKNYFEIINLIVVFLIALLSLLFFGKNMFKIF